jgi:hypothetical protein
LNGNIPLSEIGKSARTLEKIGLPFGLLYPFFCFVLVEVFFLKKKKKEKEIKKKPKAKCRKGSKNHNWFRNGFLSSRD